MYTHDRLNAEYRSFLVSFLTATAENGLLLPTCSSSLVLKLVWPSAGHSLDSWYFDHSSASAWVASGVWQHQRHLRTSLSNSVALPAVSSRKVMPLVT